MSSRTFTNEFDDALEDNGFEETDDGFESTYVDPVIPTVLISVVAVGALVGALVVGDKLQSVLDLDWSKLGIPDRKYTALEAYTPTSPTPPLGLDQTEGAKNVWVSPVVSPRISSKFGLRTHPVTGKKNVLHQGIDIACPVGTPVYAPASGTVVDCHYSATGGNMLKIKHNKQYTSVYMHLDHLPSDIGVGSRVVAGQIVAYTGNTGRSTGPHLHYEIRRYGIVSVDPTTVSRSELEKNDPKVEPVNESSVGVVESSYNRKDI